MIQMITFIANHPLIKLWGVLHSSTPDSNEDEILTKYNFCIDISFVNLTVLVIDLVEVRILTR